MRLLTGLLSCLILCLAAEQVWTLGHRKKLVTPPQQSRPSSVKIGVSDKKTPNTLPLRRISRSGVEEKWPLKNRQIVLREITRRGPSSSTTSYVGKLGQGSIYVASNAYKLTKSTVKASFDLLAGKHVSLFDISGSWAVTQDVLLPGSDGSTHSTPVTFHLAENKTLVTVFNGKEHHTKYTFQERAWPRFCTIQFDARAYQGPTDKDVVEMTYKGYFKKSILNSRILLMRGSIHKSYGKFFWRGVKKVGDFKAIKRRYGN